MNIKNKNNLFKAYYITCSLLTDLQAKGGGCSMEAEENLFYAVFDFLEDEKAKLELLDRMDFIFGLSKRNLTKALKTYTKYRRMR